ncbi:MAG: D-alanine--D-alanine ligase family protein [Pseudobdellovibrionaceae bacterium]
MKKKVVILFGGRSAEHEVSVRSAKNVAAALDLNLFDLILVGISKQGTWYRFPDTKIFDTLTALSDSKLPAQADPVSLICLKGKPLIFSLESKETLSVDVAFPVLHGTFGEDGCIQGLFKMANLPFVGCGVLGSSMGMDKEVMKRLLKEAHIPSAKYEVIYSYQPQSFDDLKKSLGLPFFIKPANAGSSVGVHKIKTQSDFETKIKDAFLYDHKVLAEEFMEGREIEVSVMGLNHAPKASVAGEIKPTHEFYSYEAKYVDDNGADLQIPAKITATELQNIQAIACRTFQVMGCDGLSRVDFFLKKNGEAYINEINTIPGFTKISMYPKMWEASGLKYTQLITELIQLGLQKYKSEEELLTNYDKLS